MHRRRLLSTLAAAPALAAQDAPWSNSFLKTLRDSFLEHWRDTREYTLAIAGAMPAEGYDSKPDPAQRTFGEQLVHTGAANTAYFASFGLIDRPQAPKATDKETVRAWLVTSFDYVAAVLARLSEKDLQRKDLIIATRLPPHSAVDLFLRAYMHTAHHRGQAVVYLRVKGITPPAWKFEPKV